MKQLTKLLLINWHYFVHETIPFKQLNFLTGKNASGKSTIIDALQLVLYGDTSGRFFNRAASGRSTRTLSGYLRGELGDDEEYGFKYLRNGRFISYIVLEFYDDEKKSFFTAGCCFDVYSENDISHLFFHYSGAIPVHDYIVDKIPMDIPALRIFLKSSSVKNPTTTKTGQDFYLTLCSKLGRIRPTFRNLMKKAVSFNPNVDIQDFISEFVCDTQETVDVTQMQENIRSYKLLEEQAEILQKQLDLLSIIMNAHQSFHKSKQDALLYSYLISNADVNMQLIKLTNEEKKKLELENQLADLSATIVVEKNRLFKLQGDREALQVKLSSDKQAQAIQEMDNQIHETANRIAHLKQEYATAQINLSRSISAWLNAVDHAASLLPDMHAFNFNPSFQIRIDDIKTESQQLKDQIIPFQALDAASIEQTGEAGFRSCNEKVIALARHCIELSSAVDSEQRDYAKVQSELKYEENTLEKGIYQFPKDVLALKEAVISRLRTTTNEVIPVVIVAEAAEIRSERWRNIIEGYLHTQKFYLIVPPEHFQTALYVYDAIKQKKAVYNTGIVDVKKLMRMNPPPTASAGSLAEEIETTNPNVRLYLDYLLGHVKKCDNIKELRQHKTAVTADGMLYQNYVARALNPDRWRKPAIGQSAIKKRLEDVRQEIKRLLANISSCSTLKVALEKSTSLSAISEAEMRQAISAAKGIADIPLLQSDLEQLENSRRSIDESAVIAIKRHIEHLEADIMLVSRTMEGHIHEHNIYSERLRVCQVVQIPAFKQDLLHKQTELAKTYPKEWIAQTGNIRYQRELLSRGSAAAIHQAFPRELSRAKNHQDDMWQKVCILRQDYNNQYKMGYDIHAQDNDAYDDAWLELGENKLPDYIARIADTKNKAFEQFREDFISRLNHNIQDAEQQIANLNLALKGSRFGEDTYRFLIVPKSEYKRYYDMITDTMKLESYNLFSEQFNVKYKDEIADLFSIITNENTLSKAGSSEDYEKRVRMFTDYRTYLSFDLEVVNRDNESQRLSKTIGKKSGGETQTPFYVAVLASFAQLYRVGRDKNNSTIRLIIFDEAFSKMDGERISRSVQLLRQLNFQAILSAPSDKIGDIVPHVDNSLCVLREGKETSVEAFIAPELKEVIDAQSL